MQDLIQKQVSDWRSQLKKGTLELAVLALLNQRSRYGLELLELLNGAGLDVREGSIYPVLARLRGEKKVTSQWVDDGKGHAHKYYMLTSFGTETLAAMRVAWAEYNTAFAQLIGDWRG
jgi:PadR family transcriptional regulator PadR